MKRFLFITNNFPPELTPVSISIAKLLHHFVASGWKATVVCADDRMSLEPIDHDLERFVPREDIRVRKAASFESSTTFRIARRMLPFLRSIPDVKSMWYPAARLAVNRVLRDERFSFLLSWSSSPVSHVVALHARARSGLPWVAHFSDPWVDNPYFQYSRIARRLNRELERAVIERADALVFNSKGVQDAVLWKYPEACLKKAVVIPHCYDPDLYTVGPVPLNDRCVFTYTGSFYGLRSPMPLLHALRRLRDERPADMLRMEFRFIGSTPARYRRAIRELGLASVIRVESWVDYLENLKYMKRSDILLVIDASLEEESIFEPAKLIDYLGAQKSVLAISSLNGIAGRMVRRFDVGEVADPRDIAGIQRAIVRLYERWRQGTLAFPLDDARIRSYQSSEVAARFTSLFEDVVARRSSPTRSAVPSITALQPRRTPQFSCPFCSSVLIVDEATQPDSSGQGQGSLRCPPCGAAFPLVRGIPRFVSGEQYAASFGMQWRYHNVVQFDSRNGSRISRDRLSQVTGWPEDLRGEHVLEVGSGAGRFTEILAAAGADVWSFDLSSCVEVNQEHNRAFPNLHLFQSTVFNIPLPRGSFDKVLCLGVLQHTPNAARAFRMLAETVRPGGSIVIDIYKKTLLSLLHWKYALRPITTRMSADQLYRVVAWTVPKLLPIASLARRLFGRAGARFFPIAEYSHFGLPPALAREWAILDTFDMYSPVHDHPQTLQTVRQWFENAGCADIDVRYGPNGIIGRGVKQ